MTEDYAALAFRIHMVVHWLFFVFAVFLAEPLWLVFLAFRRLRISLRVHAFQALLYGCGWLMIYLAGKYDPTTFTLWWMD